MSKLAFRRADGSFRSSYRVGGEGGVATPPKDRRSGGGATLGGGVITAPTNRAVTLTESGGVDCTQLLKIESHGDYSTINFYCGLQDVVAGLAVLFKLAPGDDPLLQFDHLEVGNARGFKTIYRGDGITLYCCPIGGIKVSRSTLVEMKGEFLERFTWDEYRQFIRYVEEFCEEHPDTRRRFKCTRFDWAWDRHDISPILLKRACKRGNIRCSVNRGVDGWFRWYESAAALESFRVVDIDDVELVKEGKYGAGETLYLGHRKSSRMIRCYNSRGFNRLEFESHDDRSDAILHDLLHYDADRCAQRMTEHLRDFVDFVDSSASSNISRCDLLPFWKKFVGLAGRALLKIPRYLTSAVGAIKREIDRGVKSTARLLALLKDTPFEKKLDGWIEGAISGLLCRGAEKINRGRAALRSVLQNEGEGGLVFAGVSLVDELRAGLCRLLPVDVDPYEYDRGKVLAPVVCEVKTQPSLF